MQVTKLTYEKLVNTGNYENRRYGLEVTSSDSEYVLDTFNDARELVNRMIKTDFDMDKEEADNKN
jgi:hypothetical protein